MHRHLCGHLSLNHLSFNRFIVTDRHTPSFRWLLPLFLPFLDWTAKWTHQWSVYRTFIIGWISFYVGLIRLFYIRYAAECWCMFLWLISLIVYRKLTYTLVVFSDGGWFPSVLHSRPWRTLRRMLLSAGMKAFITRTRIRFFICHIHSSTSIIWKVP